MSLPKPVFEQDTLFIACTRPAMFAGVTMEAMGINVIVTTIFYLSAGSITYALVGVVFHFIFRALIKHDHNMFRIVVAWAETRGRSRNTHFWGGSSVSPLKLVRKRDGRDFSFA